MNGDRDSARSHPPTEDRTSANRSSEIAQPGLTRSDINIDTVAPVAQRVSLAPAVPRKEQQDSELSPHDATADLNTSELDVTEPDVTEPDVTEPDVIEPDVIEPNIIEPDTHRRLDATAAAVSGQEYIRPTVPTAVSKLMASDTPHQSSVDAGLPPPTVESQGNYQLPAIHDLLPAIEPEEPIHLEEPSYIEEEPSYIEEPAYETIAVSEDPEAIESVAEEAVAAEPSQQRPQ